jgi:ABC-type transport system substrate-binding protein
LKKKPDVEIVIDLMMAAVKTVDPAKKAELAKKIREYGEEQYEKAPLVSDKGRR